LCPSRQKSGLIPDDFHYCHHCCVPQALPASYITSPKPSGRDLSNKFFNEKLWFLPVLYRGCTRDQ
jgi:hypothetical protein